jgi:hypothetical protein
MKFKKKKVETLDAGQLFQWAIWVFYASMAQPNVIPTKVT